MDREDIIPRRTGNAIRLDDFFLNRTAHHFGRADDYPQGSPKSANLMRVVGEMRACASGGDPKD